MNWKKTCTALLTLLALGIHPLSARELAEGEWYLRLILTAEAEGLEDSYNSLGQLSDALPGYDYNDLHELGQSFAGQYLSVIFYRADWETVLQTEAGPVDMGWQDFNTDFHPISYVAPPAGCDVVPGTEPGDEWTFEIRSDDMARYLSLTWEASEGADLERMVLVDLQENVTVPAVIDGVVQEYDFVMNGAVREFAWRLLSDAEYEATVATGATPVALRGSVSSAASSADTDEVRNTSGSGWLPKGWSPYQSDQSIPDGLPADPLGD